MRKNLIFTSIKEATGNSNETPETTEAKLRQHFLSAFKITEEIATSIKFKIVHQSTGAPTHGQKRHLSQVYVLLRPRNGSKKAEKACHYCVQNLNNIPLEVMSKRRQWVLKMKEWMRLSNREYLA